MSEHTFDNVSEPVSRCKFCEKEFEGDVDYCDDESCIEQHKIDLLPPKKCPWCGKMFKGYGNFCSDKCEEDYIADEEYWEWRNDD